MRLAMHNGNNASALMAHIDHQPHGTIRLQRQLSRVGDMERRYVEGFYHHVN